MTRDTMDCHTPITSAADAEGFLFQLYQHGLNFHPDDDAHDVVNGATGLPLFTSADADAINARMDEVHTFLADPCDYLLDLIASTDRN
jgi:hypothetical protein